MRFLFVVAITVAAASTQDTNCSACNAGSVSLGMCNLPNLNSTLSHFPNQPIQRNLSGFDLSPVDAGPVTFELANFTQAGCLCPAGVGQLLSCASCLNQTVANGTIQDNYRKVAELYTEDCEAFGYYANQTLGGPTTTVDTLPKTTGGATGCNVCGIIDGQLAECKLLSLSEAAPTTPKVIPFETTQNGYMAGFNYSGFLLFNRTAAQCFCTLPVLNGAVSCRDCLTTEKEKMVINDYLSDCHTLGYWGQAAVSPKVIGYQTTTASSPAKTGVATGLRPVFSFTILVCIWVLWMV